MTPKPTHYLAALVIALSATSPRADEATADVPKEAVVADLPLGFRPRDSIELHNDMPVAKALEATLGAIERGERITVVRAEKEGETPVQVELGGEKPVTPAK